MLQGPMFHTELGRGEVILQWSWLRQRLRELRDVIISDGDVSNVNHLTLSNGERSLASKLTWNKLD